MDAPGVETIARARRELTSLIARRDCENPVPPLEQPTPEGWSRQSTSLMGRLDAGFYEPRVTAVRARLANAGAARIGDHASAHLPVRYKRYYVTPEHGRPIPAGQTLATFAIFDLASLRFSPRIRDVGRLQLYRLGAAAAWRDRVPTRGAAGQPIQTQLIADHWNELLTSGVTLVMSGTPAVVTDRHRSPSDTVSTARPDHPATTSASARRGRAAVRCGR